MTYTDFGRAIYAIGGNATAARLAGINLSRVRVLMYMFSGGIAGLAGVLLTSRTTSGNPVNGTGWSCRPSPPSFWAARPQPAARARSLAPSWP